MVQLLVSAVPGIVTSISVCYNIRYAARHVSVRNKALDVGR
ncbi:MAG: hypothetical protein ACK5Y6_06140 [Pseudomonadota bacterium]